MGAREGASGSQGTRAYYGLGYEPVTLAVGVDAVGAEERVEPLGVGVEGACGVDYGGVRIPTHLKHHLVIGVVPATYGLHIATHPAEYVGAVVVGEGTAHEGEVTA